ncbi:hypothetical protein ZIOFF_070848 [Zingiber officinale]|uniref:Uncharacterized protein n=1 Tax=Zingiber officinale TaxID=94328 RepID=A0A8J5C0T1_ZINOF|nr:hypothetical protein ZIOFF_070848 [Zingiber officinale]
MSLPNKFEAKLCALEETDKLKQITFLELISALQASEKRMQIRPPEVEGVHEKTEVLLSVENLDLSNLAISRGASNLQAPSQGGYVQQNPRKKGGNGKEIYEPCPHYQEATKEQTTPSWPMTNEQVITPSAPEIVQNEDQGENGANSDLHDAESTPGQTKYCMDLLHKYGMNEANPVVFPTDYKGAITSITGREKPDVAIYRAHLAAAKRALKYVKGTMDLDTITKLNKKKVATGHVGLLVHSRWSTEISGGGQQKKNVTAQT